MASSTGLTGRDFASLHATFPVEAAVGLLRAYRDLRDPLSIATRFSVLIVDGQGASSNEVRSHPSRSCLLVPSPVIESDMPCDRVPYRPNAMHNLTKQPVLCADQE